MIRNRVVPGLNRPEEGTMRGQRGSSFVQTLFLLPVFVMIVVGGYEIWKLHSVRESLRSGTYQATRYLSINPDTWDWLGTIRYDFVAPELSNNGLVGAEIAEQVRISAPRPDLECGEDFFIRAELPWRAVIPFVGEENLLIVVEHEGEVICAP